MLLVCLIKTLILGGCQTNTMQLPSRSIEQLEDNKQVVRQIFESVWNEANFDGIEKLWVPNVIFHFRGLADSVGPKNLRNIVKSWRGAFPNFQFVVEDLIAEGDQVAARVRFTGMHTGTDWFGFSATRKTIDVTEMMFFRLHDGKVVEAWEDYDEYVMRIQLEGSSVK